MDFLRKIFGSDLDGITLQNGTLIKTIDVTDDDISNEQLKIKENSEKLNISYTEILNSVLSNKKHYNFFAIVCMISFVYCLVWTVLGIVVHYIFWLFAISGYLIALMLLTSVYLHIHDKKVLNKHIKNQKIKIEELAIKQKIKEIKDNSENEYEEHYLILSNDDKIGISKKYFDLLQKEDRVYAVYISDGSKLLKAYPCFKYNILES